MMRIEAVVIGAGHAGLAASHEITRRGVPHVVLEQGRIGDTWRSQRWDSFTLVTPNWTLDLPGFPYAGDAPDAFLARDALVRHLEAYARSFGAPVREGVRVRALRAHAEGHEVVTDQGTWIARQVIVAAGAQREPKIPPVAARLAPRVVQVHARDYRAPHALPPGGVLVVGSGQSGCQIAEELRDAGRDVWLSTGRCGRLPRRHRGRDIMWWARESGFYDLRPADAPRGDSTCNPHVSGRDGGRDVHLRALAAKGITLLGRFEDAEGEAARFSPDAEENARRADAFADRIVAELERGARARGVTLPAGDAVVRHHPDVPIPRIDRLDLAAASIEVVVWATGFRPSFPWIEEPVLDAEGAPRHRDGVATDAPGLYFLGLPGLSRVKSGIILGAREDAERIGEEVAARMRAPPAAQ